MDQASFVEDQFEFDLHSPSPEDFADHRTTDGRRPPPGTGRPLGSKNVVKKPEYEIARKYSPAWVLQLSIWVKKELEEGRVTELVLRALDMLFARTWPRPRSPAVQIDARQTVPEARTPGDLRIAMLDVAQKVASGAMSLDEGKELVKLLREVLDAYRVQTFDTTITATTAPESSARERLASRLTRLVEMRQNGNGECRQSSDADMPGDRAAGQETAKQAASEDIDVDISEEELKESVNAAVMEALRKRGYVE